jgi:amino acid permease
MGTGTLALPYAASQGGYIFNAVGLAIIMLWNLYSMDRLLKCLTLIPSMKKTKFTEMDNEQESIIEEEDEKVSNISTLEKVTFHAFGSWGVRMIDGISLCLYFGIITAYIGMLYILVSFAKSLSAKRLMITCIPSPLDAMLGFISETPITTGSIYIDGILLVIVLAPLSCASDLKFLSRFSAMGIFVLISVQITLAFSAISRWTEVETVSIFWVDLWPKDWTGVSNWFGIVSCKYATCSRNWTERCG